MQSNPSSISVQRPTRLFHFGSTMSESRNSQDHVQLNVPQSPSNFLVPRQPLVHIFVCDFANAKVKALTDKFITALQNNGINIFIDKYLTHQPGFQVRAVSFSSGGDFFFQIHSKTAGAGDVRLYLNGQPKRMSVSQAIGNIWSWWRLKSGCLTVEEASVLSKEKLLYLFDYYANIKEENLNVEKLQEELKEAIEMNNNFIALSNKIKGFEILLEEAKITISRYKLMLTEWPKENGTVLSRWPQLDTVKGLSQPLKDIMLNIISQTLKKINSLSNILNTYSKDETQELGSFEPQEIQIEAADKTHGDGSSWRYMLDEEHPSSSVFMQIASFDEGTIHQSVDRIQTPVFMLDEY